MDNLEAYASIWLKNDEHNDPTDELELTIVILALKFWKIYLYGEGSEISQITKMYRNF